MVQLTDVYASKDDLGTGFEGFDLSVAVETGQPPILVEGHNVTLARKGFEWAEVRKQVLMVIVRKSYNVL